MDAVTAHDDVLAFVDDLNDDDGPGDSQELQMAVDPPPLVRRDSTQVSFASKIITNMLQSDDHDMSALHYFAIAGRSPSDIDAVMRHGGEPRARPLNVNGCVRFLELTALHFAAMNTSVEAVSALLNHGATLNAVDALGKTPLRHAVALRRLNVVTALLEAGAEDLPDKEGCTALRHSVFRGEHRVVRTYMLARPDAVNEKLAGGNKKENCALCPLHVAASFGYSRLIKVILECGGDINCQDGQGRTPLMYAATKGRCKTARALLEVTTRIMCLPSDELPIDVVADGNDNLSGPEDGDNLIESDEEADDETAEENSLSNSENEHQLVAASSSESVCTLREQSELDLKRERSKMKALCTSADANMTDLHGWSAMHYAAAAVKGNAVFTLRVLLCHGANIDPLETRFHLTPLHMAAKAGKIDALIELMRSGADVFAATTDQRTAIHFAAYGGHTECCRVLLEHDSRLVDGGPRAAAVRPLHLAVRGPKIEAVDVVQLLISHGADTWTPVPVEVDGWVPSWRFWNAADFTEIATDSAAKRNLTTVYISPLCFAISSGQFKVAKVIISAKGRLFNVGLGQFILSLAVVLSAGRFDIAWRLIFRTTSGISLFTLSLILFTLWALVATTPSINMDLIKKAWEACGSSKGCSIACQQKIFTKDCCLLKQGGHHSSVRDMIEAGQLCWTGRWFKWNEIDGNN